MIVTITITDILSCVAEYAYENFDKIKSYFEVKYKGIIAQKVAIIEKEREAELKRKKDADNERVIDVEDLWKKYSEHIKNRSELIKNLEGTPQEPLRNSAGTPEELLKEPLDNQGVPVNDDAINSAYGKSL